MNISLINPLNLDVRLRYIFDYRVRTLPGFSLMKGPQSFDFLREGAPAARGLSVAWVLAGDRCWKWWHTATARASEASYSLMPSPRCRMVCSIFHTCSFPELPLPVTDCLIFLGEYSVTGSPAFIAVAMATPCARPSLSMLWTFFPKKGASIAKSCG